MVNLIQTNFNEDVAAIEKYMFIVCFVVVSDCNILLYGFEKFESFDEF